MAEAAAPPYSHGGGIPHENGVYDWFGEKKAAANAPGTTRVDVIGMSCYSSSDLQYWRNERIVLPAVAVDPAHDLHPRAESPNARKSSTTHPLANT